ncbi:MAG: glycosyltransferase family 4 protein [Mycobacteriales bacterium]
MRITLVSPHPVEPPDSGDRVRTAQLAAGLRALGHEVTVLAYSWRGEQSSGAHTRYVAGRPAGGLSAVAWRTRLAYERRHNVFALHQMPQLHRRMLTALDEVAPDVVDFQHSFTWFDTGRPNVVTVHNVESDRQARFSRAAVRAIAGGAATERTAAESADVTVVFSDLDAERLRAHAQPHALHVVPLGYDPGPRGPAPRPEFTTAAYVGSMDYEPNVAAARLLIAQWPAIHAASGLQRLLIVGRRAGEHFRSSGQVEVLSDVPDMRRALEPADALVVPLMSGGGVRVKIIEAFALGLPVVSTPLGIEGLGALDGVHAVIVRDVAALASGLARMREQPTRAALADNARLLWESHFSPARTAQQMLTVYDAAIAGHS